MIVEHSLGQVLSKIRMPELPVRSPSELRAGDVAAELTDADAYIINSLPTAVWGQCMIGLDFMQGLRATIAADTYLSAPALARAALESFALAFWVCDDRLPLDERFRRALLLNRRSVEQERKRRKRDWTLSHPDEPHELEQAFADRLGLIDSGIAHFAGQLDEDGYAYATGLPSTTQAVRHILVDVSPVPDGLYGKLSAVVHGDAIFTWGLLSPHPDGARRHDFEDRVLLSTCITNHLTPTWHAAFAMCINMGVARSVLQIDCDMDAMTELCKDMTGFIAHNGEEPIWYRGDSMMTKD
ncbi:MAG: hypothetical protein F4Y56_13265 [Acidimicrobiaceae bacterium]|nr:hypothetical protein [Acidimicrobiaceae bacterium]MYG78599.1 hypothetical protein [Acidimicrobiaceae bacterium]